jgi:hypothetical protein
MCLFIDNGNKIPIAMSAASGPTNVITTLSGPTGRGTPRPRRRLGRQKSICECVHESDSGDALSHVRILLHLCRHDDMTVEVDELHGTSDGLARGPDSCSPCNNIQHGLLGHGVGPDGRERLVG